MVVFVPGDKYVVVDSGGGTVDLTVHQIRLPEGHLKELYKATGEPCMADFLTREPLHSYQIFLSVSFSQHGIETGKGTNTSVKMERQMHLNGLKTQITVTWVLV